MGHLGSYQKPKREKCKLETILQLLKEIPGVQYTTDIHKTSQELHRLIDSNWQHTEKFPLIIHLLGQLMCKSPWARVLKNHNSDRKYQGMYITNKNINAKCTIRTWIGTNGIFWWIFMIQLSWSSWGKNWISFGAIWVLLQKGVIFQIYKVFTQIIRRHALLDAFFWGSSMPFSIKEEKSCIGSMQSAGRRKKRQIEMCKDS